MGRGEEIKSRRGRGVRTVSRRKKKRGQRRKGTKGRGRGEAIALQDYEAI